jgi:hypothetical protein
MKRHKIVCIKIGTVYVLHFNPWVDAAAFEQLVPEGFYSPVAKYFGICLKLRIFLFLSFLAARAIFQLSGAVTITGDMAANLDLCLALKRATPIATRDLRF